MKTFFGFTWEDEDLLRKMNDLTSSCNRNFFVGGGISIAHPFLDTASKEEIKESLLKNLNGTSIDLEAGNSEIKIIRNYPDSCPIYYYINNNELVFSSHPNSLLLFLEDRELNRKVLDSFLTYRFNVHLHETLLKDVSKLPSGWSLEKNRGKIEIGETGVVKPSTVNRKRDYYVKKLKKVLKESVAKSCKDDGTFGVLVSGGLDSSLILALATRFIERINTYTLALDEETERNGERISKLFETNHIKVRGVENPFRILPELTWRCFNPPFDATTLPRYKLVKEASKKSDYVLTGLGADELFGGYETDMVCNYLQKYGRRTMNTIFSKFFDFIPKKLFQRLTKSDKEFGKEFKQRVKKSMKEPDKTWEVYNRLNSVFDLKDRERLYKIKDRKNFGGYLKEYLNSRPGDILDSLLLFEQETKLQSQVLEPLHNLSSSLAYIRNPYINRNLFEISSEIPFRLKINGLEKKSILREVGKDFLPKNLHSKQKSHFSPSIRNWLQGENLGILKQLLSKRMLEKHGIFKSSYVRKLLKEKGKSFLHNRMVWSLAVFQIWYEMYIERCITGPPEKVERLVC